MIVFGRLDRVTIMCFAASYVVAVLVELVYILRPRLMLRWISLGASAAGLLAHSLFLAVRQLPLSSRHGSLLFLAWLVVLFYAFASLQHRKAAWGLFVLPLVLCLILLAVVFTGDQAGPERFWILRLLSFDGPSFWNSIHAALLVLAAGAICVGFVASAMFLVQARRLKIKRLPDQGVRLLSLERLEQMRRRAIILAFPFLTGGIASGMTLMFQAGDELRGWTDPRTLAAFVLWLVFAILLYLRYNFRARGRHVAVLTIVAFVLLLVTFALPHTPLGGGGTP